MSVALLARLTRRDIPLVAEAVFLSVAVNVGIRCARLRNIVGALDRLPRTAAPAPMDRVSRIVWIAEGITRRVWTEPTCLKRGLVTYALLRRRRIDASLVIAHRLRPFEAHAWVELDGRVLSGVDNRGTFHELWRVPAGGQTDLSACPERAERVEGARPERAKRVEG